MGSRKYRTYGGGAFFETRKVDTPKHLGTKVIVSSMLHIGLSRLCQKETEKERDEILNDMVKGLRSELAEGSNIIPEDIADTMVYTGLMKGLAEDAINDSIMMNSDPFMIRDKRQKMKSLYKKFPNMLNVDERYAGDNEIEIVNNYFDLAITEYRELIDDWFDDYTKELYKIKI